MMRWFLVPSSGLQWAAPDCGNGYDHHRFDDHHYHFDDHHHLDDHHRFDDHQHLDDDHPLDDHHYQFDDQHHLDDHHYNFDDQHYNLDGDHHLNDQYSVTIQLPFDHHRCDTMVKGGRDGVGQIGWRGSRSERSSDPALSNRIEDQYCLLSNISEPCNGDQGGRC